MTQRSIVQVGRITHTPGARIHIQIAGRTLCGSRGHAMICRPVDKMSAVQAETACRRCFTRKGITAAAAANNMSRSWSQAIDTMLDRMYQPLRTEAELAKSADFVARLRAVHAHNLQDAA